MFECVIIWPMTSEVATILSL